MTTTEVRQPPAPSVLLGLGVLAVGLVLGWFASAIAGGLAGVIEASPLPVPKVIQLVETLPLPWTLAILGGLGLVGGAFLALMTVTEAPQLTVADDHLEHRQEEREVWVERSDVGAAFRDTRYLVLLRPDGVLRARLDADTLSWAKVKGALDQHRWPWRDADPYEQQFAAALRKADQDLAALGLVVRVRDDRIQVRRAMWADEGARGTDR